MLLSSFFIVISLCKMFESESEASRLSLCVLVCPAVFQQQAVHSPLEQQKQKQGGGGGGPIPCQNCGKPCKGEALRVQNKHFHIKCFACKGM